MIQEILMAENIDKRNNLYLNATSAGILYLWDFRPEVPFDNLF